MRRCCTYFPSGIQNTAPHKKGKVKKMKKLIALLLAALMVMTCFAACAKNNETADNGSSALPSGDSKDTTGDDTTGKDPANADSDLTYIKEKGVLVVGITDYAPMDYKDENGNWTGFDAEFAALFAKELDVEVSFFLLADWDSKFMELDTRNIDCIWNGMTITDEVKLNTSCSNPYVKNAQVVVMKADKLASYADFDSMKALTFAAEGGSAGAAALEDKGVTDYVKTQDQAAALLEVKSGTADAAVIDITMANAMTGEGSSYADLGYSLELTTEEYGVGFRTGSDVTAKFNEVMGKLMQDGTLDALAEKYELTLVK